MIQLCRAFLGDDRDVDGAVERWRARLVTVRVQAYSRMNVEFDCTIRLLQGLFAQRASEHVFCNDVNPQKLIILVPKHLL
jgi:hypothetical protein